MVILSTLVSAIVESIFQFRNKRQDYFREIISRLFDDIIWRRLKGNIYGQHVRNVPKPKEELIRGQAKEEFLNVMTSVTGLKTAQVDNFSKSTFWKSEKKTERLTSIEFASRFAKTRSGKVIHSLGKEKAEIIVADLVRSFEDLSVGSTSDFRARARKWSLSVGMVLAFAINIDAFQIFKQLNSDSKIAEQVIAATSEQLDELKQSGFADEEILDTINKSIAVIGSVGLPVGRDYFPFCCASTIDQRCPINSDASNGTEQDREGKSVKRKCNYALFEPWSYHHIFWLLGVVSTGIFVGLGSPFWFQVFKRMSVAAQLVSGLSTSKKQPMSAKEEAADNAAPLYQEAVEAFILAAKAEAIFSSDDSNGVT
ncbi:hypothetical protein [Photobacterium profundum]|uniref:hypothetical protein n=1 Tax=Photobacterium profundum TaxID=74109 RepID=UPI003D1098E9